MKNAVGFTPKKGLLSGLRGDSNATQAARGQAMAASANAEMGRQQQNQQFGMEQMQQESQLRQQDARNQQQRAGNEIQEGVQEDALKSRKKVFDTSMAYDYAQLRKRQNMAWKQAALNAFARDM
jgi:hypothetical protein